MNISKNKKTPLTIKNQIINYLSSRRTPATRTQIINNLSKKSLKISSVSRDLTTCVSLGLVNRIVGSNTSVANTSKSSIYYTVG